MELECALYLAAGSIWAAAADSAEGHRALMLLCYVLSTASRSAIAMVNTFWPLLALVITTEAFSSPVSVIADTVIAAACAEVRAECTCSINSYHGHPR